ncbi:UbiH/UbiF family hydroxylase [Pseudoluteimonas lycopersici]|uniref:UbiH/UbiF family hydroxylase n=1 Tax=Pseudoluteimonas lycopersici TaxID=1324796 RepID=A0A516V7W5_9GAMM|nr:UbiH/UbiF family hydroxylase [Lysobacter lycopersici]QDQ74627.1 UbiH/UbiF family hydroxylase [Lysobacter lycopersici]
MKRGMRDAVVVGGGVVGAACALALAKLGLDVALVEAREPSRWDASQRDLRVYAFAPDNAALLDALGIWKSIRESRIEPYRRMRVWDAAGGGELDIDADALGRRELGWIVEYGLLVDTLSSALPAAGVEVLCPAKVESLMQDERGVRLGLDSGRVLEARIAIAADGGDSAVRALAGIEVDAHDHAQRGVVAYVETALPHEATAWQRFLPGGPLAFLPCGDGLSSIVWSLPNDEAARVLALDDAAFGEELAQAFEARLGAVRVASKRAAFPLRRQLADSLCEGRVLLAGDAAHVVHPLAGQGVNLGLRDVAALRDSIAAAQSRRLAWDSPHRLRRWARQRRSENALAAHAFDAINRVYSNDALWPTLLRGHALGIAGKLPPVASALWRHASGL